MSENAMSEKITRMFFKITPVEMSELKEGDLFLGVSDRYGATRDDTLDIGRVTSNPRHLTSVEKKLMDCDDISNLMMVTKIADDHSSLTHILSQC